MTWTPERVRKFAEGLPPKYKNKVLKELETRGVDAAVRVLNLASAAFDKELTARNKKFTEHPHTPLVDGTLTELQKKVSQGLREGLTVNKIARLFDLPLNSVKAAKRMLHRKKTIVPLSTPPQGVQSTKGSEPNLHNFVVEVLVPYTPGCSWRSKIDVSKVQEYRQNVGFKGGMQEHFKLGRVSVRTTPRRILLTITDVFDATPAACAKSAWDLAIGAAHELQAVYGFVFEDAIPMRWNGQADWALVGHEVALKCKAAAIKPMTYINGEKRMWVDDSPGKSLEFSQLADAERSFQDEEARVFRGLTNEALTAHLAAIDNRFLQLMGAIENVVKLQEIQVKMLSAVLPSVSAPEQSNAEVPYYVG